MPLVEVILKDIRFALSDLMKWIRNGFKLPVIVVSPDFPSKKTTIYKIAAGLGYRLTNKMLNNPELVIYFEDITFGSSENIRKKYPDKNIINSHCIDISKNHVDDIHLRVFGYNTFIDPLTYRGIAVQKSDMNALHDGRVIECPVERRDEHSVYQVLIDNSYDKDIVLDMRVPVFKGDIPLLYYKYKVYDRRFTNEVSRSQLINSVDSVFSSDEKEKIISFTKAMQVEFCELDVLRNKSDGRIYIIDVNKTPYGPPSGLKVEEKNKAISILTATFKRQFLN